MSKFFSFFKSPLFLLGLFVRLLLIVSVLPLPVGEWYVPFLNNSLNSFTLDPWLSWISRGGTLLAFPYGYAMWFFLTPLTLLCKVLFIPVAYGYGVSLLLADFGLLLFLRQLLHCSNRLLLAIYWLSPINLIASYCFGYNDIIPVFLLVAALYCLKDLRFILSGLLLISAISAKLSMVISLPFFLVYIFNKRSLRQISLQFFAGLTLGFCIFILPFIWSSAGIEMLVSNPEMGKIYHLSIGLVSNMSVYIVPLAYFLMLYAAWRFNRINFELLYAILGMAFLLVVLLTPASPGWFIWVLPLLVAYQLSSDRAAIYITSIFSVLYVINILIDITPYFDEAMNFFGLQNATILNTRLASLIHTALMAVGIILATRVWRETVSRNDFFRLSRKPFVIGVAGDSGAGKDTYVKAIIDLFGSHSVASISGDDYHLWDRHQPMWQVMTHINPAANDLERFAKNLIDLTDGKLVHASHYDHQTGKLSKPFSVHSNDIIIASGLHAMYLPILRACYDLSIYLDIDENLRTFFKVRRDVNHRGYSVGQVLDTLVQRRQDSEKFIQPQAAFADLVFSLRPVHPSETLDFKNPLIPRLKLVVKSRHGFNEITLKRVLIGVCGLHVDMSTNADISEVELSIEGEVNSLDIQMAAQMISPQIFEFLDLKPQWQNGITGLMQLITLSHIHQALTRRFI